jgi:hypothetical protein
MWFVSCATPWRCCDCECRTTQRRLWGAFLELLLSEGYYYYRHKHCMFTIVVVGAEERQPLAAKKEGCGEQWAKLDKSPQAFLLLSFRKCTVTHGMYVCGQTKAPGKQLSAGKDNARITETGDWGRKLLTLHNKKTEDSTRAASGRRLGSTRRRRRRGFARTLNKRWRDRPGRKVREPLTVSAAC